ncbi:MAG: ferritin [Deinococcota bacterium]|jgi:ferritin|nr:ferritin [Deinococcota bacterium]
MISQKLAEALNEQIASEFGASNHYLAIAAYFAKQSLDLWAGFFYRQSEEEREHGLKILRFLIDNDADLRLPAVGEAGLDFENAHEAVSSALESERKVSRQFDELAALATKEKDYRGLQFLQWFVSEQVEEEATMGKLVDLTASGINLFQAQQFLPAPEEQTSDAPA